MPSSLAMHTMSSEESLHNNMKSSMSATVKRVHFAPLFEETRRHSSQSLDSIPESSSPSDSEDNCTWSRDTTATSSIPTTTTTLNPQHQKQRRAATQSPCPTDGSSHEFVRDPHHSTQSCACGKLRHSDIRHAAHRIPSGKSRRESVEAFDDVKKRWYHEWLSDSSAVVDEPWGGLSDDMDVESSLPLKFGVHHW